MEIQNKTKYSDDLLVLGKKAVDHHVFGKLVEQLPIWIHLKNQGFYYNLCSNFGSHSLYI